MEGNSQRDWAVNVRVDRLTRDEAYELEETMVRAKREKAPNARGTSVVGLQNQLSAQPIKEIESVDEDK